MDRMNGKVALISGGARGMGAEHARRFIAEGARVVIGDLLDDEGGAVVTALGDNARYVHLDVTSSDDWSRAVATAVETFGGLNVLVNNAGIGPLANLSELTQDRWERVLEVNLTGTFLGISAAAEALKESAPSSIVNISSISGLIGGAAQHAYVASKFGVRGLTKSVAAELAPFNVRANSIHPGIVETPMTADMDYSALPVPLGRPARPEEISALAVYLASDESSYSTGSEFTLDGGQVNTMPAVG